MKQYKYSKMFTYDGKRYNIRADTQAELYTKMANKIRDLEEGKVVVSGEMKVKDWIEKCISTYKASVSARTREDMQRRMRKYVIPEIGSMKLKQVTNLHLQAIINQQAGMSDSFVRKLMQEISFIFKTAKKNHIILENPAEDLQKPRTTKGSRRSLTDYEKEHFLKVCDENARFNLFLLMYYCGCRPSEAIRAQGKDIDRDKKLLHIRGTKTANSDRIVPIPDPLYDKIKDTPPFAPIAPNAAGNFHSRESYIRASDSLKRALNISMGCKVYRNALVPPYPLAPDFVPYCLRHTYCTNLQKMGIDVRTAQKLMGHASIQTTVNIYTHVDDSEIIKAGEIMDAAL